MKRFRFLMVCLALAVCTTMVFAQNDDANQSQPQSNSAQMERGHRGRGMRGGMRGGEGNFLRSLNLTQDQKDKMRPIMQQQREQMRQVFQDQSLSREQRMQKMQQIRENSTSQIRALLTPDQQQKFDEHEQQMKQRMQQRMQQRHEQGQDSAPSN